MSVVCPTCAYDQNASDAEFCEACGAELPQTASTAAPAPESTPVSTPDAEPEFVPIAPPGPPTSETPAAPAAPATSPETPVTSKPSASPTSAPTTAPAVRLVAKQTNAPQPEFPLNGAALVGIFDSDSGPVDIDLESFAGGETVSRQHAEIYAENGTWMVKDIGSTNGIFIKPNGQSRFGARITIPTSVNPGDEIAFGKVQFLVQSS